MISVLWIVLQYIQRFFFLPLPPHPCFKLFGSVSEFLCLSSSVLLSFDWWNHLFLLLASNLSSWVIFCSKNITPDAFCKVSMTIVFNDILLVDCCIKENIDFCFSTSSGSLLRLQMVFPCLRFFLEWIRRVNTNSRYVS